MTTYFAVLLIVIVIGYGIAFTRKGSVATTRLGSRRRETCSELDVATVYERLALIGGGKFSVDDKDPQQHIIILSSPVTFFTWGFLYPVYLYPSGNLTRIEVGCSSKFFQIGPLVTKAHDECIHAILAALSVPVARVA
jgi:hypothetical protein